MSVTSQSVSKINISFGRSLIDVKFLQAFQKDYYYDFLYQIHFLRKIKKRSQKSQFLQTLSLNANQLLSARGRPKVNFSLLENSTKTTDTVFIIRQVVLQDGEVLNKFLEQRKKMYQTLKQGGQIQKQRFKIFNMFYDVVLHGNHVSSQRQPLKVMIGIRKLLRQSKSTRKDIHDRRNKLYQTNRAIKQILQHSMALKKTYDSDQEFINSINILLNEKKWLGPNLYKLLRKYKWKGYQIDTLVDLMEESIKKQARFNQEKTKMLLNRTIQNIRSYSKYLKENPNNAGSFRLISTISNGLSNIFSIQDMENIDQGFLFQKSTHQIGHFSSRIVHNSDSQIVQEPEQ